MTNEEYYALMKLDNVVQHVFTWNYVILLWLLVIWLLRTKTKAISPLTLEKENRYDFSNVTSKFTIIISILPMAIWAGTRDDIQDTLNYRLSFQGIGTSLEYLRYVLTSDNVHDRGFSVYMMIVKSIFGSNEYVFLGISAFITLLCISHVYRRLSCEYSFSMFIYFVSCDFYSWVLNGTRQGMAVAFVFIASLMLLDRKYFKFILFFLLAFSFHATSLVFLVAFLFLNQKPFSRRIVLIEIGFVIILLMISTKSSIIDDLFGETHYAYAINVIENTNNGVNPIRVLVYSVPTIIAFFARKQIHEMDDSIINFAVNMSFIGTLFYVLGMFTSAIFIGRFPIYFTLWNYVLLAWELNYLFKKKSQQRLIKTVTVSFYFVYNFYQIYKNMKGYM